MPDLTFPFDLQGQQADTAQKLCNWSQPIAGAEEKLLEDTPTPVLRNPGWEASSLCLLCVTSDFWEWGILRLQILHPLCNVLPLGKERNWGSEDGDVKGRPVASLGGLRMCSNPLLHSSPFKLGCRTEA